MILRPPEPPAHAALAPSAAYRWTPCPGSRYLASLYPETIETEEAREGTAAHWAFAEKAAGREIWEGQYAPNGWVLDPDIVDGADLFLASIPDALRPLTHFEARVSMSRIVHPQNWGTPDAWAYDFVTRTIYVWDYKFGHGFVDAFENWQLIDYVAGIVEQLGLTGADDLTHRVVMTIVQPRVWHRDGHVRRWSVPLVDLRGYWNRLTYSAEVAMEPDAPLQVGQHCEHCPARHACPALMKASSRIATHFETAAPLELPDNALGYELRQLKRLETILAARISGLEADAESRLRKGRRVPWFKLTSAPGREKWTAPAETVLQIGQLYGVDLSKPTQTVTPNQARQLGVPEDAVKPLMRRDQTAMKVTLFTDDDARRLFTGG